jgi:SNF2 family DNA or RNA helicase
MKFVANALESLEIDFRACIGSMKRRDTSIQEFKSGNVPILILSSEDSVSGLNLTEATHVVIFHPFLIDSNGGKLEGDEMDADTKMALSFEKQGIARAWRSGQQKQVEVVRFAIFISNIH